MLTLVTTVVGIAITIITHSPFIHIENAITTMSALHVKH